MIDHDFSPGTRALFAESRLVACELGYDYISSQHMMLTDCRLRRSDSLLPFIFGSYEQYSQYFKSLQVDESTILAGSLPLTKEAEEVIRTTIKQHKGSKQTFILPRHFFLVAISMPGSAFYRSLLESEDLAQKLDAFYQAIPIDEFPTLPEPRRGLLKRLFG